MKTKLALLILAVLCFAVWTPAQDPQTAPAMCGTTPVKMPVVRGLRLGLAPRDVKALFPESYADPTGKDEVGYQHSFARAGLVEIAGSEAEKTAMQGIGSIWFEFLDDRLVSFEIDVRFICFVGKYF
jgi:hypothetical protein